MINKKVLIVKVSDSIKKPQGASDKYLKCCGKNF